MTTPSWKDPPEVTLTDLTNPSEFIKKYKILRDQVAQAIGTLGPNRGQTAWGQALTDVGLGSGGSGGGIGASGTPSAPSGFTVGSGISHIFVSTDAPTFTSGGGYLKTRIYGATYAGSGPLPTFSSAVVIDEFTGAFEAVPENPSTEWHLWVTWVAKNGNEGPPAGGTNGLTTTTGQDVSTLLTALDGQITQSQLFTDLSTQIDLIGAGIENLVYNPDFQPSVGAWSSPGSIVARTTSGVPAGAPSDYVFVHSTRDDASVPPSFAACTPGESIYLSVWVASASPTTVACGMGLYFHNAAGVIFNTVVPVQKPAGVTTWVQAFASVTVPAGAVQMQPFLWIDQPFSGGTNTVYFSKPCVMRNAAAIAVESSTRQSETGELFAQYTVKVDVNGYVSGFGLASTPVNGTPFSAFAIRADQFYVASPTGPGISPIVPFIVQTTPTTINGQAVPVGVYMNAAYIENGTITNAKIGFAQIDDALVANLSASKLTAGSIAVGQYIQSSNYIAGTSGWRIDGNGNAELSNAIVRGTVYASSGSFTGAVTATSGSFNGSIFAGSGTIAGNTISSSDIHSPGFTVGSTGWQLTSGGAVYATELHVKDSTGLRIFDTGATGTQPVLKIGSAILIDAAGNASFGGTLTAANVVGTTQIVANAVTDTNVAQTAGTIAVSTSSVTVQTLTITTAGEPVLVIANASIGVVGGGTPGFTVQRDGGSIYSVSGNDPAGLYLMYTGIDIPAAGSHTYTILAISPGGATVARDRTIGLLQMKR